MNREDPCICGHTAFQHGYPQMSWCSECISYRYIRKGGPYFDLYEHKFKLDNLKYLEMVLERTSK